VIRHYANLHIESRVYPKLSLDVSQSNLWDGKLGLLDLNNRPKNLIGAMWLQAAQAVSSNKTYRRCQSCNIWFELAPSIARSDKQYCTNSCRMKFHRDRIAQAQALNTRGISTEEIAQQLETDVKHVRNWVQKGREKATGRGRKSLTKKSRL
jgi:hypothetical protein